MATSKIKNSMTWKYLNTTTGTGVIYFPTSGWNELKIVTHFQYATNSSIFVCTTLITPVEISDIAPSTYRYYLSGNNKTDYRLAVTNTFAVLNTLTYDGANRITEATNYLYYR